MVLARSTLARPALLVAGVVTALVVAILLFATAVDESADRDAALAPPPVEEAPAREPLAEAPVLPETGSRTEVAAEKPRVPDEEPAPAQIPGPPALRVLVVDVQPGGEATPAQGVTVQLNVPAEKLELREVTDEKGLAVFPLGNVDPEAGRGTVVAQKDEHFRAARAWASLAPDDLAGEPLELRRLSLGPLTGTVVDDFGAPLAGARVILHREDEAAPIEVVSGADGTFVVEELAHLTGAPRATHDEYVLLRSDRLEPDPEGGWRRPRVVMTRSATLFVQVVDADGAPVADRFVEVRIATSEKGAWHWQTMWADARDSSGSSPFPNLAGWPEDPPQRRTDAQGEAYFGDLWSGRRLSVHENPRDRDDGLTRVRDGVLVADDDTEGVPLVLAPGEQRIVELRIVTPSHLRVEGAVLDPAGNPLPGMTVLVERLASNGTPPRLGRLRSAADGRYECDVNDVASDELLRLSAHGTYREDLPSTSFVGVALADPAAAVEGVLVIDVRCESSLALAGRIVDPEGAPVTGWVDVEPEDASDPGLVRSVELGPGSRMSGLDEGTFRIGNLGPGLYTLRLRESRSGGQWVTSFPHLAAGAEDLELVVEFPANVTIRVRAETDGLDVTRCIALLECLGPPEGPVAEGNTSHGLRDPARWPLQVPLGVSGNHHRLFMCQANEPAAHEWPTMRAGRYTVGLEAWTSDEEMLYPVFGEPVDLGAGVHEFTADLHRGGPLEGRVVGDFAPGSMAVALVDDEGRLLPIFSSEGNGHDVMPCYGQGHFQVDLAPAGDFTLLVGSEGQIRAGAPVRRVPVQVRPEGSEPLVVELR